MRIAFYAPLKPPAHGTPSGDRRVAELLIEALRRAGHAVHPASDFCSLDMQGDPRRQTELRDMGLELARQLVARWSGEAAGARPDLWLTYHVYYKAPDWIGPVVSAALGIPYVIAEGSFAPKRAGGPWALNHETVREALARADLLLAPTRHDIACLLPLVANPGRIVHLPPFLDAAPFQGAISAREAHRTQLSATLGLETAVPWIVTVAMMRAGDKLASYRELAATLGLLRDLPWQLLVAGDGPARAEVVAALEAAAPGRARFLGQLAMPDVAAACAAGDLAIWPAVNEAYGMALLEAQAAGLPVVSCALRGVPDVVCDGETGLLAGPGNPEALAALARRLLVDQPLRQAMGRRAWAWVASERGIDCASRQLDRLIAGLAARASVP
jgi:glycosyltransferase involved in cell wall biosynthesis